jgi:glycosyltransferase involved in cell wall biosynthesis
MRKKKVLLFIRALHGGGAQRAMVRYANALSSKEYDVCILTLDSSGAFSNELNTNVKVIILSANRILSAIPQMIMCIRNIRPNVIMVTEPACNIALIIANMFSFTKSRLLIREGLFPSVAVKESPYIQTRIAYRLAPFFYKKADVIVAIASEMADDLSEFLNLPRKKITLIPINPVVTSELYEKAGQDIQHPWVVDKNIPVIIGVGRLEAQKDFETLIKSFCLLRKDVYCKLLILGEGSLRESLSLQISNSGYASDIELVGFCSNPFPYMSNCDVLVLSSRYEGLPNTLIEALACGAPSVSTDCKSGPKDILDHGKYGCLVPVGDEVMMSNAIKETMDRPIDKCILKERGACYTLENSINAYLPFLFPEDCN